MTEQKRIPNEVYTRVVGYFRPESCTNKGKRQEINDRKTYDVKKIPADLKNP